MADARTLITEWESIDPVEFPAPLELKPLLVDDSEKLILKEYEVVLINTKLKGRLFITNFRTIFMCGVSTNYIELGSIPLTSIESVEKVDVNQDVKLRSALRQADKNLSQRLVLTGKDTRIVAFSFQECEIEEVYDTLVRCSRPAVLGQLYAFAQGPSKFSNTNPKVRLLNEYFRLLGLGSHHASSRTIEDGSYTLANDWWRISSINSNYTMCPTYPFALLIPKSISDAEIQQACTFRTRCRLPAISWCHPDTRAVLARSSQPRVGPMRNRSYADEKLIHAFLTQVAGTKSTRKLYIVDARSRQTAFANVAKGGGYELSANYTQSEVVFLGIENIHVMRQSFDKLRNFVNCHGGISSDGNSPFLLGGEGHVTSMCGSVSTLRESNWLMHVQTVLTGSVWIAARIALESASVLVHCSDGWDRTTQLVSLSSLLLDPYYRTIEGFQALVEKDWLAFGHRFSDRLGLPTRLKFSLSTSSYAKTECSPIFLQWVDCVSQLLRICPLAFEFTPVFLRDLLDSVFSSRWGNFFCNSENERHKDHVDDSCGCLWGYMADLRASVGRSHAHYNPFYAPSEFQGPILPPAAVLAPTVWPHFHLQWSCPEFRGGEIESRFRDISFREVNILKDKSATWPVVNPIIISVSGPPGDILYVLYEAKKLNYNARRHWRRYATWQQLGIAPIDNDSHLLYPPMSFLSTMEMRDGKGKLVTCL